MAAWATGKNSARKGPKYWGSAAFQAPSKSDAGCSIAVPSPVYAISVVIGNAPSISQNEQMYNI
jgi:hypothetical protein